MNIYEAVNTMGLEKIRAQQERAYDALFLRSIGVTSLDTLDVLKAVKAEVAKKGWN